MRRSLLRWSAAILIAGLLAGIAIYLGAGPEPVDPLAGRYENKEYLRQMEMYGGTANVLSAQFMDWFTGLWRGRNLAFTVAALAAFSAFILWFFATRFRWDDE